MISFIPFCVESKSKCQYDKNIGSFDTSWSLLSKKIPEIDNEIRWWQLNIRLEIVSFY